MPEDAYFVGLLCRSTIKQCFGCVECVDMGSPRIVITILLGVWYLM